jgi:hypothetical protein
MKPLELFNKLENTGNHFSYFKKGRKYVYFSTGGYSENEELISELERELCFKMFLVKWEAGGHYTFKIPPKELLDFNFERTIIKVKNGRKTSKY